MANVKAKTGRVPGYRKGWKTITKKTITNAFVGFGIDHDTVLFNKLGNLTNSGYYFIDKLENAGLVYGEILHGVFYKYLQI